MSFRRRQHNATLLPDGTILVTGGTQGGGGIDNGFNDLTPGEPVHEAELWDPVTETWTVLAAESMDRCYHSTAILLPDGTVLSAGGGEYNPGGQPIEKKDVHTDGQVFRPPYLFRGERPQITLAPDKTDYNATFTIKVAGPAPARITALKPISVTHAMDANQRFLELSFKLNGDTATVTVTARRDDYPPGHYMLFALSPDGVPSIAHMLRIGDALQPKRIAKGKTKGAAKTLHLASGLGPRDREIEAKSTGTPVTVGLTSRCPYGLAACWGGALQTLKSLDGVDQVKEIANASDSTAELFLQTSGLPNLDVWTRQISAMAGGGYDFRGVEVTLTGTVRPQGDYLILSGPSSTWTVKLDPLAKAAKVQWDWATHAPAPATADEAAAYQHLADQVKTDGERKARVTGPLNNEGGGWQLAVRQVA
jgi:hypothetical protein